MARQTDDEIFKVIIKNEGTRYTNDPSDFGGPTKFGITLRAWQNFTGKASTPETIQSLTIDDARSFYNATHIHPFDRLEDPLRLLIIDISILRSVPTTIKMLQGAGLGVTVDGWIGKETLDAILKLGNAKVTNIMVGAMCQHYALNVQKTPSQTKWLNGWRNRVLRYYVGE